MTPARRFWLSLSLILAIGAWLRGADLGKLSFDYDEYLHVLPARQIAEGGEPALPSGNIYKRARPYTEIVAASFRAFGVSETSARLPSVLFGLALVAAVGIIGRRWFGDASGLIAAALVATFPLSVDTARLCRMYAPFQLAYLLLVASYFEALERRGQSPAARTGWALLAAASAFVSFKLHVLTADALVGVAGFWAAMAAVRPRSRYSAVLGCAAAGAAALWASGRLDFAALWTRVNQAPSWGTAFRYANDYYLNLLLDPAPWLLVVAPAAIPFLCARHRRTGLYVACQIALPLAVHSLIFDWKAARYISHLIPLLALASAPLLAFCIGTAAVAWGRRGAAVAALATTLLLASLAAGSLKVHDDPYRLPWRSVFDRLARETAEGDAICVSIPLAAQYYLPAKTMHPLRGLYVLNNFLLIDHKKKMKRTPDGIWLDWYSGLPLVTSLQEFRRLQQAHDRGWIVADRFRFESPSALPEDLRAHILKECRLLADSPDPSIVIYQWSRPAAKPARMRLPR